MGLTFYGSGARQTLPAAYIRGTKAPPVFVPSAGGAWKEHIMSRQVSYRHRIRRWVTAVVVGALAVAGVSLTSVTAHAATHGYGTNFNIAGGGSTSWLGSYRTVPGGHVAMCAEPWIAPPVNFAQSDQGLKTSWTFRAGSPQGYPQTTHTVSGTEMRALNYVLRKWGGSTNGTTAARAALAVKVITAPAATARDLANGIYNNVAIATRNAAAAMAAEARAAAQTVQTGAAALGFDVSDDGSYVGDLVLAQLTHDATGTITLTNGVFDATGAATYTGSFAQGDRLAIRGVPPAGGGDYKISAHATFESIETFPAANVRVWTTAANRQTLVGPGGVERITMTADAIDPVGRSLLSPTVTTAVRDVVVEQGEPLVDRVTVHLDGAWPTTAGGTALHLDLSGTLWGPFAERPAESVLPPADAPFKASAGMAVAGPGTYETPAIGADEPGYYVWVWAIRGASQTPMWRSVLPAGYEVRDEFGLPAETTLVLPTVTTTATQDAAWGDEISDIATLSGVAPGWQVGFSAYAQPVDETAAVCDPAELVFESPLQPAELVTTSPGFTPTEPGTFHWVATLYDAAGGEPLWAAECGEPGETSLVTAALPAVTTVATPTVLLGAEIRDTATLTGWLGDLQIGFAAYLQAGDEAVCEPANSVFESPLQPLGPEVESDPFTPTVAGTYLWVATLHDSEGALLWTAECGEPGETSVVAALPIVMG